MIAATFTYRGIGVERSRRLKLQLYNPTRSARSDIGYLLGSKLAFPAILNEAPL